MWYNMPQYPLSRTVRFHLYKHISFSLSLFVMHAFVWFCVHFRNVPSSFAWLSCVHCFSLLMWNNETLNIWSHLLGFLLFVVLLLYDNLIAIPKLNGDLSDHIVVSLGILCYQVSYGLWAVWNNMIMLLGSVLCLSIMSVIGWLALCCLVRG